MSARLKALRAAALAGVMLVAPNGAGADGPPKPSGFDFYVLALSWSPTFCASAKASSNRDQCGEGKRYGLVVHGLWPQNERGYPENCPTDQPRRVPEKLGRTLFDIMPSMGLIGHQWRKHGTCSGLAQADYFALTRAAYERVRIPDSLRNAERATTVDVDAIETQFTRANAGMTRQALAVTCERGKLSEIRVCLTPQLAFRDCPEIDAQACSLPSVAVPPAR
ncbi:ribonuclease T2 family protein [Ciceribacter azotifigens]|uniref:ribonuclease T2 family protein n=1 Tax=Ciceribacter azotifigens TaxID=2069303 RepID=UPI003A85C6A0